MAGELAFQLYSPTKGSLDLASSSAGANFATMLYGYVAGVATPATSVTQQLIGNAIRTDGWANRDDVSFLVRVSGENAAALADGVASISSWRTVADAEFRFKPAGGAWACFPLMTGVRGAALRVELADAPVASSGQMLDEHNSVQQGQPARWVKVTLSTWPFALAADATTTALSQGSSALTPSGDGEAPASLQLSGSSGLGPCLIHTGPLRSGFAPRLRSTFAAGGSTGSYGAGFAGSTWVQWTGRVATATASTLAPGGNVLVANVYNNGAAQTLSLPLAVTVVVSGTTIYTASVLSPAVALPANGSALAVIGGVVLPIADLPAGAQVTFTLGTAANVFVDEIFVLPTSEGTSLSLINAGTNKYLEAACTVPDLAGKWFVGAGSAANKVPVMAPIQGGKPVLIGPMTITAESAGDNSAPVSVVYREAYSTLPRGAAA